MHLPNNNNETAVWFFRIAIFVTVVAILRLGRDVLMPVTFAVVLVFMLAPMVVRLTRRKFPKAIAIIATVTLAFVGVGAIGWLVADQAIRLGKELPNYESNLHQKIAAFKQPHTPAALAELATMIDKLGKEIATPAEEVAGKPGTPAEPKPVPVEVRNSHKSPVAMAREVLVPLLHPLGTAVIVIVFVVAMLFQREDLRDRFIKLVSAGQINVATQAFDDASQRISRYLWMQLIVNASYGIPVGIGLSIIGVPSAPLWGLMATILRFIPFVGPWIAAAFPLLLSIVIDPGWTMLMYTIALFVVMELVSNNLIEVILYGASTGISSIALLVAAAFWTWLWGIGGLVLSTPLTVCLLVMGKYVPGLRGLSVILGSEPVLEPPAQFYQRMLSMESEDMLDLASKFIEEHSLEEFYETVFIPALSLSEVDRHRGSLGESRQTFIFQASRDLIDELERRDETDKAGVNNVAALPAAPLLAGLSSRDTADELAALMLGHLLRRRGIPVAVYPVGADVEDALDSIAHHKIKGAIVSALPPSALVSARQMCRRIRLNHPKLPIFVGIWSTTANREELEGRLAMVQPTAIATSLTGAVAELERLCTARPVLRDAPLKIEGVSVS